MMVKGIASQIKKDLKAKLPTVKFSVTSDVSSSSIYITFDKIVQCTDNVKRIAHEYNFYEDILIYINDEELCSVDTNSYDNHMKIIKKEDNEVICFDPLFKQHASVDNIYSTINWLCSFNIFNGIPADNIEHDLIKYLKIERSKYDEYTLNKIDFLINL